MDMNKVMQAAHQYAIRFPGFARGEITAAEIDAAEKELEEAVKNAITAEREACAKTCESLWDEEAKAAAAGSQEPRYHDCIECAHAIRMRSNARHKPRGEATSA